MTETPRDELYTRIEAWLGKMVELQRKKVLAMAREIVPKLTGEDILNPHDFPELMADSNFNFEDGQLAGLISAHIAVRSEHNRYREERGDQGVAHET